MKYLDFNWYVQVIKCIPFQFKSQKKVAELQKNLALVFTGEALPNDTPNTPVNDIVVEKFNPTCCNDRGDIKYHVIDKRLRLIDL